MHGPLNEIGLIEVLQLLERGGRSGVLRVSGPDPARPRTLRLRDGRVVAVEPDADDAAVARALGRHHLMAPAGGDDDAPVIEPATREAARQRLARVALGTMLHWTTGRFDFSEGPVAPGPLAWSADALVLALVEDESRRVERAGALDGWHAVPVFADADTIASGPTVTLEPIDWLILDAIDGERDVAEIAARLEEPLEEVGERIRALIGAAILQLRAAPVAATSPGAPADVDPHGAHEGVVARWRERIRRDPGDAEGWRGLGLAEVGAGRFERAIEAWTAWSRAAPDRADDAEALIRAARTMMEAMREGDDGTEQR